jgi:hypothetical protein
VESKPFQPMCYIGTRKNDEPSDMVRILSEMEKCTSNINFDGWPAKISFEAYLHIPVSKAEEGNYESYNLQGVYLCTLSSCCCWDRGWGALTHFYFALW